MNYPTTGQATTSRDGAHSVEEKPGDGDTTYPRPPLSDSPTGCGAAAEKKSADRTTIRNPVVVIGRFCRLDRVTVAVLLAIAGEYDPDNPAGIEVGPKLRYWVRRRLASWTSAEDFKKHHKSKAVARAVRKAVGPLLRLKLIARDGIRGFIPTGNGERLAHSVNLILPSNISHEEFRAVEPRVWAGRIP